MKCLKRWPSTQQQLYFCLFHFQTILGTFVKSLTLYNHPTVPRGHPLLLPQTLRLRHRSFLFIDEKHCESQSDSVANMISIRALSLRKEWVELRIFSHLSTIMAAEWRGLNVQILVQIRSGSARMGEEWQGQGEEFYGTLNPDLCGNLHTLGKIKAGWQTKEEANSPPLSHSTTPPALPKNLLQIKANAAQTFCLLPCQESFFFNSFSPSWNEVSTLWLSFRSKFLKYFIIYKRFPYWLRTGKNMNVQTLRVPIIKISIVMALVKQRLFLKDFWRKIFRKHGLICLFLLKSFILFVCVWVTYPLFKI